MFLYLALIKQVKLLFSENLISWKKNYKHLNIKRLSTEVIFFQRFKMIEDYLF